MRICPWTVPCVCGGHPTDGERLWYHRDLGYIYGFVISEHAMTIRIQLTRDLASDPGAWPAGGRWDFTPQLMEEQ